MASNSRHATVIVDDDQTQGEATVMVTSDNPESPYYSSHLTSPITSPVYWNHENSTSSPERPSIRNRTISTISASSSVNNHPFAIRLLDNEAADQDGEEPNSQSRHYDNSSTGTAHDNNNATETTHPPRTSYSTDRNRACWAKSVRITDHVVINSSSSTQGIGSFIVFIIRVETLTDSSMTIRKRYSEFDDFRQQLVAAFPGFEAAVPELPPKSWRFGVAQLREKFLERRRAGLEYFLNCILLNPEFAGSPLLRDFLF